MQRVAEASKWAMTNKASTDYTWILYLCCSLSQCSQTGFLLVVETKWNSGFLICCKQNASFTLHSRQRLYLQVHKYLLTVQSRSSVCSYPSLSSRLSYSVILQDMAHFTPNPAKSISKRLNFFFLAQFVLNALLLSLLGVSHSAPAQLPAASRHRCRHRSQSQHQLY